MTPPRQALTYRIGPRIIALIAAMSAGLTGCALDDGAPWGRVELVAKVRFAPASDRLSDKGELLTVHNEAVQLSSLAVTVRAIHGRMTAGTGATSTFDPAKPPPGYSLCHGGHCHKDDGTLPTYAEIEAELAGGADASATSVSWATADGAAETATAPTQLALDACSPGCDVDRGRLTGWRVELLGLTMAGAARSTASTGPLSGAGRPFKATWPGTVTVNAPADVHFDREHSPGARIELTIDLPQTLLDGVALASTALGSTAAGGPAVDLSTDATASMATLQRLGQDTRLRTHITRFDP